MNVRITLNPEPASTRPAVASPVRPDRRPARRPARATPVRRGLATRKSLRAWLRSGPRGQRSAVVGGVILGVVAAGLVGTHAAIAGNTPTPSGGPPSSTPPGNVQQWITQAEQVMQAAGHRPFTPGDTNDLWIIIRGESGGNPHSINTTDSNAAAGHPSEGLMQTIDSTFAAHALPGHGDIWNPVDNIVAGDRYAESRYGSLDNVPGVAAVHAGGTYVGY